MTRITSGKIGVDITATNILYTDATLPTVGPQANMDHVLGDCVSGQDGTEFQYCQSSGIITQYDWVGIDENNQAASLTKAMADDGFKIGVAQVTTADNDGVWVATEGRNLNGNVLASCAADVALYTSLLPDTLMILRLLKRRSMVLLRLRPTPRRQRPMWKFS